MRITALGLSSSLAGSSVASPPLASFLQSAETASKILVLPSSQNIIRKTSEIILIRGFDFFIVAKPQRTKIHPAIVAIIAIVNNRTSKGREEQFPSFPVMVKKLERQEDGEEMEVSLGVTGMAPDFLLMVGGIGIILEAPRLLCGHTHPSLAA